MSDRTMRSCASGREGFTLVEVLAAMIILAVGLLGLQSLSIHAARSVALAHRQSEYTFVATRHLEAAVDSLRRGQSISCGTLEWPGGISTVRRSISGGIGEREVRVEIVPDPSSGAVQPRDLKFDTHVFVPNAIAC